MSEEVTTPEASSDPQAAAPADPQATPSGAGTDGGTPESKAAVQTEDGAGKGAAATQTPEAAKVTPPAAAGKSREEIEQEIRDGDAAKARAKDLEEKQADLRKFRQTSPIVARDALDALQASLRKAYGNEVEIPPELRKPILDLVETANLKAFDAAKLEVGDEGAGHRNLLIQTSNAFYENLGDDAEREKFSAAVRGKESDPKAWVTEFGNRREAMGRSAAVGEFAEAAKGLLGEGEHEAYAKDVKDAKDATDVLTAYGDARFREGNAAPPKDPRLARIASGTGKYRSMGEVNAAKLRGELTDTEYLEASKAFGIGV